MARTRYSETTTGGGYIRGRSEQSVHFKGLIEGGPELAARLAELEKSVRDELLKEVTKAGGEVIAEAWRDNVRSLIGIGPGVAHYAESIDTLSRAGKNGATAVVGIKEKVPLNEGEAHPWAYASRFEFGSTKRSLQQFKAGITHAGRQRAAIPTLRPAFDAKRGEALDVMADLIRRLIEAVAPLRST